MKGLLNYFRGLAIGVCALIPGISGGTMALLLGIYERLISAIGSFSLKKSYLCFKLKKSPKERRLSKSYLKSLDLRFILTIVFGVLTMLLLGAIGIKKLLDSFHAYTLSFFIGLIIASIYFIYKEIDSHKPKTVIVFSILGVLAGLSFLLVTPSNLLNPPFWYLIFSGFFSVSALFFPGISGSLILLLLGVYHFMISMLVNPLNNLIPIASFAIGMIIGAIIVSKLIAYLFRINKPAVMYFLIGLIIGSIPIPIKDALSAGVPSVFLVVLFFIIGFLIVFLLERVVKK